MSAATGDDIRQRKLQTAFEGRQVAPLLLLREAAMKRMWRGDEVNTRALDGRTVCIVGYGIQGRAQAHNLRDSGVSVIVGGRKKGTGIAAAREDGFDAFESAQAAARADIVFVMTPDNTHERVLADAVNPSLKRGGTVGFACGYSLRFGNPQLREDVDVIMVAPKGPGRTLRERFLAGSGLPALLAVAQDATGGALETAVAYAAGIGSGRVAVIESTFGEEADTDLFGEQAVLCGGIPKLMEEGFRVLVDSGYSPEAAYIECIWEAKAIVDLIFERGIEEMYAHISPTARYGGLTRGAQVIDAETAVAMQAVLDDIRSGTFAEELASAPVDARPEVDARLDATWARLREALGA